MSLFRQNLGETQRALLTAQKNDLLDDDLGQTIEMLHELGVSSDFSTEILLQRVNRHTLERVKRPFELPKCQGDYRQGFCPYTQAPITFSLTRRLRHSLTIAQTGSGKTNLSRIEILTLLLLGVVVWIFDLRKNEYSCLATLAERIGKPLQILPIDALMINLLQIPSGVQRSTYIAMLTDLMIGALDLPPNAKRGLYIELESLSQEHEARGTFPILIELRQRIRNSENIVHASKEALLSRIDPLLIEFKNSFAYREGWSIAELSKCSIVFKMNELSEMSQNFLTGGLLLALFSQKIARHQMNRGTELVVILDECARMLSTASGTNPLVNWIPLVRGAGISLDLATQFLKGVPHSVIANCPNKRLGITGHPGDLQDMAQAMNLDAMQIEYLQRNVISPGHFVMSVQGERKPFEFKVPLLKVPNQVPDKQCELLKSLKTVPAHEFFNWKPEWMRPTIQIVSSNSKNTTGRLDDDGNATTLTNGEIRILQAVMKQPGLSVTELRGQARMNRTNATNARKLLKFKGIISESKVQMGQGRPTVKVFLAVTGEEAQALLREN